MCLGSARKQPHTFTTDIVRMQQILSATWSQGVIPCTSSLSVLRTGELLFGVYVVIELPNSADL